MNKILQNIITGIILIGMLYFAYYFFFEEEKIKEIIKTEKVNVEKIKDSLYAIIKGELTIVPKERIIVKEKPVNVDSIYAIAKKNAKKIILDSLKESQDTSLDFHNYYSEFDTNIVIVDTNKVDTLGSTNIDVRFRSRIPLDIESFFELKYDYYIKKFMKTITIEKRIDEPFWKEDSFFVTVSALLIFGIIKLLGG